jgi:hypothetical protein
MVLMKMKTYRKICFLILIGFLVECPTFSEEKKSEKNHTLAVSGMVIPIFTPAYNVGLNYDYQLTDTNKNFGFSLGVAWRYGFAAGVPGSDKLRGKGDFFRSDLSGKFWWHLESHDTRFGLFFGLSCAYVRTIETLIYEAQYDSTSEVGQQVFNRVLPGYILGGKFQRKDSDWNFGFAIGGLIAGTGEMSYTLPTDGLKREKTVKLGSEFFLEFSVGYSF